MHKMLDATITTTTNDKLSVVLMHHAINDLSILLVTECPIKFKIVSTIFTLLCNVYGN